MPAEPPRPSAPFPAPPGLGRRTQPGNQALLLVGHGSHLSHRSSLPVRALARELRARGLFPEVRVAFWKEDPHLHHALDTVEHPQVAVLPIFTSTGYFTEVVVPRELGLSTEGAGAPGRRVLRCDPVGSHPRMAGLVLDRALETGVAPGPEEGSEGESVALVVVGHGTPRHPESGAVTRELVADLRPRWRRGPVAAAFLDQDPRVDEVIRAQEAAKVVVVPFFISEGWHAGLTLPRGLGVEGGRGELEGREVRYAKPVGTHPSLVELVVEMVDEAWRTDAIRREPGEGTAPPTPARKAKAAFLDWIAAGGPEGRTFLQLRIRPTPGGGFDLLHRGDERLPPGELTLLSDPEAAAEVAGTTGDGRHRPLSTAPDLRRGWRFSGVPPNDVWTVLSHLYPAAAVHWHLGRTGAATPVSFRETAARQTGMYAPLRELPDPAVEEAIRDCCHPERCLRQVAWPLTPEAASGTVLPQGDTVPCLEPCSLLLTRALQALDPASSRDRPRPAP
jgi:sirohydrochlorin cobaltochelatase